MPPSHKDSSTTAHAGKYRALLAGWFAVLVCSLLLYDALLYSSLNREAWRSAEISARLAAAKLAERLSTGVALGKRLGAYHGLQSFLDFEVQSAGMPMAVLDAGGNVLAASDGFPAALVDEARRKSGGRRVLPVETDEGGRTVHIPVTGRDGAVVGHVGVRLDGGPIERELAGQFRNQLLMQALLSLAGLLAAGLLLRRRKEQPAPSDGSGADPLADPAETFFPGRLRRICLLVFLAVLLACGSLSMVMAERQYTAGLGRDAERTGLMLTETLDRLLLTGVTLDRMDRVDGYLAGIAQMHGGAIALDILDAENRPLSSSAAPGTALLSEHRLFPLLAGAAAHLDRDPGSAPRLRISLVRGPWLEHLRDLALDFLTMTAIALICMVELFLLLTRGLARFSGRDAAQQGAAGGSSALVRALAFFFVFGLDMPISFFALQMGELVPADAPSRSMMLGLPICACMAATGVFAFAAGTFVRRFGIRLPLMLGMAVASLAYAGCLLAREPWLYVAACALSGAGYGTVLLCLQVSTVRDGRLADMYSGFYAGSLCGSAMGAMLAERFGFPPVFLAAGLVMLCAVPLGRLFVGDTAPDTAQSGQARLSWTAMRRLLCDRSFLVFALLALMPLAMVYVGFTQYFLPVYLNSVGTSQSNIGRVYMVACLFIIYCGPLLGTLVKKARMKSDMVGAGGLLFALSLLSLAVLPPLPGAMLGAVLIGLGWAASLSAQSEFLLGLDAARAIGVDQSMSLLNVLQRAAQVLGPLGAGAILLAMSVNQASILLGCGIAILALTFVVLARLALRGRRA
ncbi:MAG: MFS transporter [Desulfovibrionaceae bacterium]|nr:MFS transporter [Desulfovibrionaceae bacterium]